VPQSEISSRLWRQGNEMSDRIYEKPQYNPDESHSAYLCRLIAGGDENPFHTLEAQGENIQMCWVALAKQGIEVWERAEMVLPKRPQGKPGELVYHLRAAEEYNHKMLNVFSALLPDLKAASEGDIDALARIRPQLEELAKQHQERWDAFRG
jgi:hypothetical protein